jgi:cyclophilin family peptidyl-prolyl cis-trans isomerase
MIKKLVFIVIAGVLVLGLYKESLPTQGEKLNLVATLSSDKASVMIGEEIQLELRLENTGDKEVEISEFVFDERSVVFTVDCDLGEGKKKSFEYGLVRPDALIAGRLPLGKITLQPKKSLLGLFKMPMVIGGKVEIKGKFTGTEKDVASNAITVEVKKPTPEAKLFATIETTKGNITIQLLPQTAPNTVMNFVNLSRKGFYDGLKFFRIGKDGKFIQAGCPFNSGIGGPGYTIKEEINPDLKHEPGTVSFSHREKDHSSGSQFFISLKTLPYLDGEFTIFGKVEETSMNVANDIGKIPLDPATGNPKEDVTINKVVIEVR